MNEDHFREIDATALYIEDARARAERAAAELRSAGADDHLVSALAELQEELSHLQKRLLQQTHFAVPPAQSTL